MNSVFCSTWCCGLIRAIARQELLLVTLCHIPCSSTTTRPLLVADVHVASSSRLRIKPDRNIWTCLWGHVSSHFCWVELLGLSRDGCLDTPWRSLKMENVKRATVSQGLAPPGGTAWLTPNRRERPQQGFLIIWFQETPLCLV